MMGSSMVAISCTGGLPAGAQCLFTPSTPLTPGSSSVDLAMSISTGASTSGGPYSVTVTGTSGSLSRSTTVSLTVSNPVGSSNDFQLAATQAFPTGIAAGVQTQAKVSVTANYGGSFNVNCDASAISGQCLIAPINPVAISANAPVSLAVAVNVPNSINPGTYNIALAVADSAGQPSHSLLLPLTVIPDFSVTSETPSQTLSAGQTTSGAYQLTVAPNPQGSSFAGVVTLSCASGLPAGAHCIFSPSAPVTLGNTPAAVLMTISTATREVALQSLPSHSIFYGLCLLLPGIVIGWNAVGTRSAKRRAQVLGAAVLFLLTWSLLSCGGASNGGTAPPPAGKQPTTYQITVTGASAGTTADAGQSAVVTLVVN